MVLPGVTIGRFAMIGAGSVVTRDVPPHGLAVGAPARLIGYVCACGRRLKADAGGRLACAACGRTYADPPGDEETAGGCTLCASRKSTGTE